jgi:hypothetical protein
MHVPRLPLKIIDNIYFVRERLRQETCPVTGYGRTSKLFVDGCAAARFMHLSDG